MFIPQAKCCDPARVISGPTPAPALMSDSLPEINYIWRRWRDKAVDKAREDWFQESGKLSWFGASLSSLVRIKAQSALSPSKVTDRRPQARRHLKEKHICITPINRIEATTLLFSLVVENADMHHSLNSGSTTLCSTSTASALARAPKSTE